jgi:chorismate lyase/3-hydroxybenzoate synthase
LLAGGTASIFGEDSVHVGDLRLQLGETFENLAALVTGAFGPSDRPLERYREVRVYYVHATDLPALREAVATVLPGVQRPEWMRVELCRGDLRVEIEGLAELA